MLGYGFEEIQIAGLQPSLFSNKLKVSPKTISLLCLKIKLLPNGCWEWNGARRSGYGAVRIRALSDSVMVTHRVCYQLVHGPLDNALDLHHKTDEGCIGPACCNPDHVQPASKAVHTRDLTPKSITYLNARKLTCPAGHDLVNGDVRILKNGMRQCRICDKIRAQEKRDRLRTRAKYAKDPAKLKTHCFRGHSLTDESNLRWIDSPTGKQKVCLACEAIRRDGYKVGVKAATIPSDRCKRGHKMEEDNIYVHPDGIRRSCRACRAINFGRQFDGDGPETMSVPDFSIEDGLWMGKSEA